MPLTLTDIIGCLDLRRVGDDEYEASNYSMAYPRIFGGQLLAQSVRALTESGAGKAVKSFTQHFPREGDPNEPVTYRVSTIQSGRSFATCSVAIVQGDRTIGSVAASLHTPEDAPGRWDAAPSVTAPEDAEPSTVGGIPWETRIVEGGSLGDPTPRPAVFRFWMRAPELASIADVSQQWVHQALLAHASDSTVIGTALLPVEGLSQADAHKRFTSAVTSHSMWFHGPLRLDDWVLVDQHGPIIDGSRGFGRADVWTRDGRLVASLAQESLIRMRST